MLFIFYLIFDIIFVKEDKMSISTTFICKCKKQKGWITENRETKSCPNCGKKYIGKYNSKKLTIDAIEIKGK